MKTAISAILTAFLSVLFGAPAQSHSVTLNWNPQSGDVGFKAYRATETCPNYISATDPKFSLLALLTSPTYVDTKVDASATYCYFVTATAPNEPDSPPSGAITVQIPDNSGNQTPPPSPPILKVVMASSAGHIVALAWVPNPDGSDTGTYGIYFSRTTCALTKSWIMATKEQVQLFYTFDNVIDGNRCYRVTAVAHGKESAPSNAVDAIIGSTMPGVVVWTGAR
ncbi:hypothetical protein H7849_12950 [Alloacidobacterium dinghuense]|uniref:Fibronectin type-III domain-containing protein n=1 Tax=Alloacidobacterium dinghuense TaxID=2763107 RepID=A0A7G8BC38_9BACT|nr:hypothetical protein [Alloacidobacterium dinghuense]QNI30108.1 hypothetical protein H7849_12950 [Alloacidobacterium dinghuense]